MKTDVPYLLRFFATEVSPFPSNALFLSLMVGTNGGRGGSRQRPCRFGGPVSVVTPPFGVTPIFWLPLPSLS